MSTRHGKINTPVSTTDPLTGLRPVEQARDVFGGLRSFDVMWFDGTEWQIDRLHFGRDDCPSKWLARRGCSYEDAIVQPLD